MVSYRWVCKACGEGNAPSFDHCEKCGCKSNASGDEAEKIADPEGYRNRKLRPAYEQSALASLLWPGVVISMTLLFAGMEHSLLGIGSILITPVLSLYLFALNAKIKLADLFHGYCPLTCVAGFCSFGVSILISFRHSLDYVFILVVVLFGGLFWVLRSKAGIEIFKHYVSRSS